MSSETIYPSIQDIFNIGITKPCNLHHLKRYFKFIKYCLEKPRTPGEYTESHHILPKAKDLFPEFTSLSTHKWNKISLSSREHLLAHIMLYKAYGGSQSIAVTAMFMMNDYMNRTVLNMTKNIKLLAKHRKLASEYMKNKPGRKQSEETKAKLRKPKSEETKAKMRAAHKTRKPPSAETKRKIGESAVGRIPWNKGLTANDDERISIQAEKQRGVPKNVGKNPWNKKN